MKPTIRIKANGKMYLGKLKGSKVCNSLLAKALNYIVINNEELRIKLQHRYNAVEELEFAVNLLKELERF